MPISPQFQQMPKPNNKFLRLLADLVLPSDPADAAGDLVGPMMAAERVGGKVAKGLVGEAAEKVKRFFGNDEMTGLPLNSDGTVTLFHHTSKDAADQIKKTQSFTSKGEPDIYFTTHKKPDTGYGDTVVPVKIDPKKLMIDDEFPDGRMDFRVSAPQKRLGVTVPADASEPLIMKSLLPYLMYGLKPNENE